MNIDIQTMLTALAVMLLGNGIVSGFTWKNAKLERAVFGFWSMGQVLFSVGMLLIALRGEIAVFLSLIVGNLFLVGGQVAIQEGCAVYVGKKGLYRPMSLVNICLLLAGLIYAAYFEPSVNLRIVIYSAAATAMSLLSIITLQKKEGVKNAPEKMFIYLQAVHICLMLFRSGAALLQNEYASLLHPASIQAWIIMGLLSYYSCQSLCFFWLVARRLSMEVQRQAVTDPLTGLSNRRALDEALQQIGPKNGDGIGFLFIDVDNFKTMNDSYGHQAGDAFLIRLAEEIKKNLRADDLAFRYAGDELAVIIRKCNQENLLQAAERIRTKVNEIELVWEGRSVKTTVSIGAALSTEQNNMQSLIKRADDALYEAKAAGRNLVRVGEAKRENRDGAE